MDHPVADRADQREVVDMGLVALGTEPIEKATGIVAFLGLSCGNYFLWHFTQFSGALALNAFLLSS